MKYTLYITTKGRYFEKSNWYLRNGYFTLKQDAVSEQWKPDFIDTIEHCCSKIAQIESDWVKAKKEPTEIRIACFDGLVHVSDYVTPLHIQKAQLKDDEHGD